MTITVTINAANTSELHYEMQMLLTGVAKATIPAVSVAVRPSEEDNVAQAVAVQNVEAAASPAPEPEAKKERKPRTPKAAPAPVVVPETPAEVKAQDEADEAAESVVSTTPASRDGVRAALGKYVQKFGAVAVEADAPALFKLVFPDVSVSRISEIPDTEEAFAKAIAGIEEMLAKNPYNRTPVGA